jgi:hypothetical protein
LEEKKNEPYGWLMLDFRNQISDFRWKMADLYWLAEAQEELVALKTGRIQMVDDVSRMRRDQNDHAKTNSQTPEPEGSGRKHCETELPMRLLDGIITTIIF